MYYLLNDKKIDPLVIPPKKGTILYGKCQICGKEFNRKYYSKNQTRLVDLCSSCLRKQTNIKKFGVENPFQSEKIKGKIKQTNLKKYGSEYVTQVESVKQKMKESMLKKYGVAHALQNREILSKAQNTLKQHYGVNSAFQLREVRKKIDYKKVSKSLKQTNLKKYGATSIFEAKKEQIKQTNLRKYGAENPFASSAIQEKIRKTMIEKYGVSYSMQSEEIKEKAINTTKERYNVPNILQTPENIKRANLAKKRKYFKLLLDRIGELVEPLFDINEYKGEQKRYKWRCRICGHEFTKAARTGIPRCPVCFPNHPIKTSSYEEEIVEWLKQIGIENIQTSRRILDGKEIDIFLPEYKFGIEINGLYWHSEIAGLKDKKYHLTKWQIATNKGIRLVQIFEDEWRHKKDIVKSIILHYLRLSKNKIFARNTTVKELTIQEAKQFFQDNHLQGFYPSGYKIGLVHENEIVAAMMFKKARYSKLAEWEITRYATRLNVTVVGGFSKLLKNSKIEGSIISYADLRFFNGTSYTEAGFEFLHQSSPNYFYTDYMYRYSREKFQKHKLENILEHFEPKLSEWQNMQLNGWDRIWDCGNYAFIYKKATR